MPRKKGSVNFGPECVTEILDIVEDIMPIGKLMWDDVAIAFNNVADRRGWVSRDADALKKKFRALADSKKPTGDPDCPEPVRRAKAISAAIDNSIHGVDLGEEISSEEDRSVHLGATDDEDIGTAVPLTSFVEQDTPRVLPPMSKATPATRKRRATVDDAIIAMSDSLKAPSYYDSEFIKSEIEYLRIEVTALKGDIRELRADFRQLSATVQQISNNMMSTLLNR